MPFSGWLVPLAERSTGTPCSPAGSPVICSGGCVNVTTQLVLAPFLWGARVGASYFDLKKL